MKISQVYFLKLLNKFKKLRERDANSVWHVDGFIDNACVQFAQVFGIGRVKKAPGTWGSLPGLGLGVLLRYIAESFFVDNRLRRVGYFYLDTLGLTFIICVMTFLGTVAWYSIRRMENVTKTHDHSSVVIDEVFGQMIAVVFYPISILSVILSFVFFRLFDIVKPWPISYIDEKWKNPLGTLIDDTLAGIAAFVIVGFVLNFLN